MGRPDMLGRLAAELEATVKRYRGARLDEIDWERFESEIRLAIAAHAPFRARFSLTFAMETWGGDTADLLITEQGAVRA